MSYLAKLESSRKELVYWVTGKEGGKPAWYYVKVNKSKLALFKIKLKSDYIQLRDYGTILYSGWDVEPPADIKAKIKEQFG